MYRSCYPPVFVLAFYYLGEIPRLDEPLKVSNERWPFAIATRPTGQEIRFRNILEVFSPPSERLPFRVFTPACLEITSTRFVPLLHFPALRQDLVIGVNDLLVRTGRRIAGVF